VKQSELFDRWKSLQMCRWAMNISEANQFKSTLSRCCNAPSFLFTTQKNTPLGTKLKYEVDTSGIYHINQEIFRMFPKDMPYYRSQFKKCAVVGNGGILKNSRCGREINSADFVFRCNLPPISEKYTMDVGVKTDVVTVNPSIITERSVSLPQTRAVQESSPDCHAWLPATGNAASRLTGAVCSGRHTPDSKDLP